MASFALEITAGDQRRVRCVATWPADVPELGVTKGQSYNLSTATKVWFTAKTSVAADDASAVIKKDTSLAGVNDITFVGDTAYFDIVPADTVSYAAISRAVKLVADLQVKSAGGEIWTVAEGTLTIKPQITQASS